MARIILYLLVLFCAFFFSCNADKSTTVDDEPIQFRVQRSLLGKSIRDSLSGIEIHIPKGWIPLSPNRITMLNKQLVDELVITPEVTPVLIAAFADSSLLSACSLVRIIGDSLVFKRYYNNATYEKWLKHKIGKGYLGTGSYTVNTVLVDQYLMNIGNYFVIRLIAYRNRNSPHLQIDFIIAHSDYISLLRTIESSIGSITSISQPKIHKRRY